MTIDEEFQKLIPPLTDDEYQQLEENCIKEGIREAILVWDRGDDLVIVDGHNRYKIAREHNLKWSHKVMHFESREDAMLWMIDNQLGKRNLDKYDAVILHDKKQGILSRLAKKKQGERTDLKDFPKKSWESSETREKQGEKKKPTTRSQKLLAYQKTQCEECERLKPKPHRKSKKLCDRESSASTKPTTVHSRKCLTL